MEICEIPHRVEQSWDLGRKAFPSSGTKEIQHVIKWSPCVGTADISEYKEALCNVWNLSLTILVKWPSPLSDGVCDTAIINKVVHPIRIITENLVCMSAGMSDHRYNWRMQGRQPQNYMWWYNSFSSFNKIYPECLHSRLHARSKYSDLNKLKWLRWQLSYLLEKHLATSGNFRITYINI